MSLKNIIVIYNILLFLQCSVTVYYYTTLAAANVILKYLSFLPFPPPQEGGGKGRKLIFQYAFAVA